MNTPTKEDLQFDCKLKAKNLQTALDSVVNYNFQSDFLLQNFIRCKKESIEAVEKLLQYLESDDLNKKRGTIRPTVTPLN